jgi:hypothetical protein
MLLLFYTRYRPLEHTRLTSRVLIYNRHGDTASAVKCRHKKTKTKLHGLSL